MSSNVVVSAKNLSKAYTTYDKPSDRLKQALLSRLHRAISPKLDRIGIKWNSPLYYSQNWALQPFDFEIHQGETVGVIGRNGSGKSTLLSLICGTINPTTGSVATQGRVGALLELGSGFNPEFTGRENVFLNANILGFPPGKTDERLNDIISFADIGDFIDKPVKTYSSGMTMRLAFSVIANIDCELLIVDEALAVGDAYFQQKCMRWLRQFQQNGTVLFCSHDVGAILSLCTRAVWLDEGRVQMMGAAKEVCESYNAFIHKLATGQVSPTIRSIRTQNRTGVTTDTGVSRTKPAKGASLPVPPSDRPSVFDTIDQSDSFGSGLAKILNGTLLTDDEAELFNIQGGECVRLVIEAQAEADLASAILGFIVKDRLGQPIFGDNTLQRSGGHVFDLAKGDVIRAAFRFRLPLLAVGRYSITLAIATGSLEVHVQHHWVHDALMLDVNSAVGGVVFSLPANDSSVEVSVNN